MQKILLSLLAILFLNFSALATTEPTCYSAVDLDKLAKLIVNKEKCELELKEKQSLIERRLIEFDGPRGGAFWQEPSFIVAGMAVSFSLGGAAAFYLLRNK